MSARVSIATTVVGVVKKLLQFQFVFICLYGLLVAPVRAGDFFDKPTFLQFEQELVVSKATADQYFAIDLVQGHSYSLVMQTQQVSGSVQVEIYQPDSQIKVYQVSDYLTNNSFSVLELTPAVSGRYTLKVKGVPATVRLQMLRAYANPNVSDQQRSLFPSFNTSRYISSGTHSFRPQTEYQRFEARTGDQISINILSLPVNGGSARFRLYTPSKPVYLVRDDQSLAANQRHSISFTAQQSGVYYLRVDRNGAGSYQLEMSGVRADSDDDGDGLSNAAEWYRGSAIALADTNLDGTTDYQQALSGTRGLYQVEWLRSDVMAASTVLAAKPIPYFDQPFSMPMDGFDKYLSFEVAQGESVALDIKTWRGAGSNQVTLYGPGAPPRFISNLGYFANNSTKQFEFTARLPGTYYLKLDAAFGQADIAVYRGLTSSRRSPYAYQQTALTAAPLVDGELAFSGDDTFWYFIAKPGDRISLQLAPKLAVGSMAVSLYSPGDSQPFRTLTGLSNQRNNSIEFTARHSGVYFMQVRGDAGRLGLIASGLQPVQDSDADGLPDALEYLRGLDPSRADSNRNGQSDAEEVSGGRLGRYTQEWSLADLAPALNPAVAKVIPYFNQPFSLTFAGGDAYIRLPLTAGQPVAFRVLNQTNAGSVSATVLWPDGKTRDTWTTSLSDGESQILSVLPGVTGNYYVRLSGDAGLVTVQAEHGFSHAAKAGVVADFAGSINTARYYRDGEYSRSQDDQFFRFVMLEGDQISVALTPLLERGSLSLEIWGGPRDDERRLDDTYSISDGETGQLVFNAAQTGVYYLKIKGQSGRYRLNATGIKADLDQDNDGLSSSAELVAGLNPENADSNANQVNDLVEAQRGLLGIQLAEWLPEVWQEATSRNAAVAVPYFNRPFTLHLGTQTRFLRLDLNAGDIITLTGLVRAGNRGLSARLYRPVNTNSSAAVLSSPFGVGSFDAEDFTAVETGTHYLEIPAGPGVFDLAVYRGYRHAGINDESRNFYGTAATAQILSPGKHQVLAPQTVFRFNAEAGQKLSFAITPRTNLMSFDFKVTTAADLSSSLIDFRRISDGETKAFNLTAPVRGEYLVFVRADQGSFNLQTEGVQIPTYQISYQLLPEQAGAVSCSLNPVQHGGNSLCQATANTGFQFSHWSGSCSGSRCQLENVRAARAVRAHFSRVYSITAASNNAIGGTIEVSTKTGVEGSRVQFKVKANTGFRVSAIVGGDCPAGQWLDEHTYETGAVSGHCEVKFLFNPESKRRGLPWWVLMVP